MILDFDPVQRIVEIEAQLSEAISQRQSVQAQYDELHQHTMHTLAYVISKVADAAIVGQGPYTALQFHEFTLNGIDKLAAQRQSALDAMASAVEERDRLRGEMASAAEERAGLRASLAEYVEAFKAEAADNIALKNELAAANQDAEALASAVLNGDSAAARAVRGSVRIHDALAAHEARVASQPPAEAEGA